MFACDQKFAHVPTSKTSDTSLRAAIEKSSVKLSEIAKEMFRCSEPFPVLVAVLETVSSELGTVHQYFESNGKLAPFRNFLKVSLDHKYQPSVTHILPSCAPSLHTRAQ
jgi:hypothetical protein